MVKTSRSRSLLLPLPRSCSGHINVAVLLHLVVLAFLAPLCSAIHFTNTNWDVRPGEALRLTWADQVKWATITLMKGRPEASTNDGEELVVSYFTDLEYNWQVPVDKPDGEYFLHIHDLSGNTNFSPVFRLQSAVAKAGSGTATTSTIGPQTTTSMTLTTFSLSSPPSATGTATGTGKSQPTSAGPNDDSAGAQSVSKGDGLSVGAKAGIACAVIGVLGLLGGASYFFYLRGKAVGASSSSSSSRRNGDDHTLGRWGRRRKRLHSTDDSDLEGGGAEKDMFARSPSPTPRELSGEDKLPPELGAEVGPTEIGTDWPVVAELSSGELCVEEMKMEKECGETKMSPARPSSSSSSPSSPSPSHSGGGGREGEGESGKLEIDIPATVSPLTPSPKSPSSSPSPSQPEADTSISPRENEKCLRDGESGIGGKGGHGRKPEPKPGQRGSKMVEIQIKLKDNSEGDSSRGER